MPSDAITLLKRDHREVKRLFREFRRGSAEDDGRAALAETIIGELSVHTHLENAVFYPAVREWAPDLDDEILESFEEHHVVDLLAAEILALPQEDEHWEAKMTVLMELVEHHVREEEQEWFPIAREELTRSQLRELGARMEEMRPSAPRRPDAAASAGRRRGRR